MTDQTTRETSPTCPECGSDAVIGPLGYRRELHCQSCWHYFQPTPTVEGSGRTEDFAATLPFRPHPSTPDDDESKGCLCGKCGGRYRVDVQVPNDLWPKIAGATELLCPRCIAEGLEAQGEFAAFRLVDVSSPTASRGTGVPTWETLVRQVDEARDASAHCASWTPDDDDREYNDLQEISRAKKAALLATLRTLSAAAEQGERDREDAERYRFLRDNPWGFGAVDGNAGPHFRAPTTSVLDDYVDIAMADAARPPHQGRDA